MHSLTYEEVELLLEVARDASLGWTFQERFEAVTEALGSLIPTTCLSVIVIEPPDSTGAPAGLKHGLFRNNTLDNLSSYVSHYRGHDPMGHMIDAAEGTPGLLSDFVDGRRFGRDAFTGEFLPAQRLRFIMGLALGLPDDRRLAIALHREPAMGDFTVKERTLLRLAGPDLARAAQGALVRERLSELEPEGAAGSACGVLVFDSAGELVHADPSALRLVEGVRTVGRPLLDDLAAAARPVSRSPLAAQGGHEQLIPLSGCRALRVRTTRLDRRSGSQMVVVVEEVGQRDDPFPSVAERAGLSPREREVAALAIEGLGNRHIGYKLGISAVTVGVHLTSIYRKTKVSGRTELARLMSGGQP